MQLLNVESTHDSFDTTKSTLHHLWFFRKRLDETTAVVVPKHADDEGLDRRFRNSVVSIENTGN